MSVTLFHRWLPIAVLAACAWSSSCALNPQSPQNPQSRSAGRGGGDVLREADGRYQLGRPFEDFYDTAFVLTQDGKGAPRAVDLGQVADTLQNYDVVFYGERHGHPGVHLQQMKLLRALVERNPRWVVSFEQFERDVQGVVDDYMARRIGETTLIDKGRAWNNYAASYRPLVLFARDHQLPVVAAEAPGWTISCVGQWGPAILDRFTPLERTWVANDVHVEPGPYQDKFMEFMGSSPVHGDGNVHGDGKAHFDGNAHDDGNVHGEGSPHGGSKAATQESALKLQRSFAAQVARDDTMAESIESALQQHPGYKVLHLTGSFHAEAFLGTVERLRTLDPKLKVAVIEPLEVEDPRAPAFTADSLKEGTVLQLVYPNPDSFAEGEDASASLKTMAHAHHLSRCKYSPPGTAATHPPARSP